MEELGITKGECKNAEDFWNQYKNKTYTQQEARKMDYELDILHELISKLYDVDYCTEKIKATLDKIERNVASKPNVREVA